MSLGEKKKQKKNKKEKKRKKKRTKRAAMTHHIPKSLFLYKHTHNPPNKTFFSPIFFFPT
jgi:hypothetical protein